MRTALAFSHLDVVPGNPVRVAIDVTNNSDVIDGVTALVDGLDPAWVQLETPVLSLFPSSTAELAFVIDVPIDCPAGDYLIVTRIVSTIDADRQSVHDFWISVAPVVAARLNLRPTVVTGGTKADIEATFENLGNAPARLNVAALDPTREVNCRVDPPAVNVLLGQEAHADIRLKGPRPWFGTPVLRSIVVTATAPEVELEEVVTFRQKPRIPRGLITFLLLAGIVALWAAIFLLVATQLISTDDAGKAAAEEFDEGGVQNVPLTAIAGTASGRVTAATTGDGIPRITVEAFRVRSSGELLPSGSAATQDDGTYELASLLPGTYKLKISADGYTETWFPSATDAASAGEVTVTPADQAADLDVVLGGETGAFIGEVELPETTGDAPTLTVTATRVLDDAAEGVEPEQFTAETTGLIELTGLPAPATYTIRVEGGGLVAQEFEEAIEAGEAKVMNTVRLSAATGSITGNVVNADGQPLGGVTVTVRSGDFELETTTPTTVGVGGFVLPGLETPRTYVLDFALEGFSGQTVALDLLGGENRTGVQGVLIGGDGSVSGTARSVDGTALGGVTVLVQGGDFNAETSTLTTSSATGGVGSYRVTDIPTPGVFTVTFSLDGYVSETLQVGYVGAGARPGTDVVLRPFFGQISGTVTGSGSPLGDVEVALNDGSEPRRTSSATVPAGTFSFADVAPGTYTLRFQAIGHFAKVVLIRVGEGETLTPTVDLDALPESG